MSNKTGGPDLCDMPRTQQVASTRCVEAQVMCTGMMTCGAEAAYQQGVRLHEQQKLWTSQSYTVQCVNHTDRRSYGPVTHAQCSM